ncbi:MAG: HEAT repeat domain-containing protein, partial [Chloroflexi bacterium]|nr:HEAT repeat domain-containing protein [Chloroflexota bacterium]
MEDKAPWIATGQPDTSNREHREETFSLWDALDLAFVDNHPPEIFKSLTDSFSGLDTETVDHHPPDMLKALTEAFSSLDTERQTSVLRTLGEIGRRLPDGAKKGVISYFLAKRLDDPSEEVRFAAIQAVGMLTRQALTKAVVSKMVSDESTRVRAASAEALGELTASVTLHTLKDTLSDPSWEVRAAAIQTLGKLSERLIIEPLKMALDDQDFSVRGAALHTLGTLKACLPTEYLVSLAQEETNDWITRDAAVTVLERVGEYAQAKPLREKLDQVLEMERRMAEEELLAFPDPKEQEGFGEQEKPEIQVQQQQDEKAGPPASLKDSETGNTKTTQASKHEPHKGETRQRYLLPGWCKDTKNKEHPFRKSRWGEKAIASHLFSRGKGMLVLLFLLFLPVGGSILHSYAKSARTDPSFKVFSAAPSPSTATLNVAWQPQDYA